VKIIDQRAEALVEHGKIPGLARCQSHLL
jgi:hypothetical protein